MRQPQTRAEGNAAADLSAHQSGQEGHPGFVTLQLRPYSSLRSNSSFMPVDLKKPSSVSKSAYVRFWGSVGQKPPRRGLVVIALAYSAAPIADDDDDAVSGV